ncbi:hypothetical protein L1994_11410 [Methanomicrobium antiquum]|uniref:Filamentation induced by cAMP protein Fic-like C-terminal domain-containing protein n=1 Tax=Methanomicrobium antiquum TaxID=487686 RepID=A0AAF0FVK3_9EURY|nr:hypothetical protein [Methanomicrobium antiquum]WFN36725.1 hypothetical protein L1994_11410 [Methanomicrobium antiquum]
MSADLQSSRLKKISEAKLCEYPGTDKLIEKVTFEADSLEVKPGTLKGEASITKHEADSLKGKYGTLKHEAYSLKGKYGTLKGEASITKHEADSLKGKSGTLKHEVSITKHEAGPLEVKPDALRSEADSLEVKSDTLRSEALTERDLLLSSLSEETKMALLKLGKRTRPEIMKDLIREICSQKDFTLDELCIILGRKNSKTLYDNYIKKLLNEKKLIKTNPDKPTSPNQKYKTVLSQKEKS